MIFACRFALDLDLDIYVQYCQLDRKCTSHKLVCRIFQNSNFCTFIVCRLIVLSRYMCAFAVEADVL